MTRIPPFPAGRSLKILRITVDQAGEIHPFRDAADHDPESYWNDLLHDPRGRVPNGPGYWQTLAARRDTVLKIACDKCPGANIAIEVNDLLQRYNGKMRVIEVVLDLMPCSRASKRCNRVYNLLPRNV